MGAAEQAYKNAVGQIPFERGTPEYAAAKRGLWHRYEAARFQLLGDCRIIRRYQVAFARAYFAPLKAFYDGELPDAAYRLVRIALFRKYAERLYAVGLVTEVFDPQWVLDFASRSLAFERSLLPVPAEFTGFTSEDAALLCNPLRDFSMEFFRSVHSEFGVGRLRLQPDVYDGIDEGRIQES